LLNFNHQDLTTGIINSLVYRLILLSSCFSLNDSLGKVITKYKNQMPFASIQT